MDVYIARNTVPNAAKKQTMPLSGLNPRWQVQTEREHAYERVISTLQ